MMVDIRDDFIEIYKKLGFTEDGIKTTINVAIHSQLLILKPLKKFNDTWWHHNLKAYVTDCNTGKIKIKKMRW